MAKSSPKTNVDFLYENDVAIEIVNHSCGFSFLFVAHLFSPSPRFKVNSFVNWAFQFKFKLFAWAAN